MTLALGSASDDTTCDTSFTSASVMSLPPVMLYTTPVARSMERSIRGADVAASAASRARPFPLATPTPSMAVPESRMMALTSAKSTLTCLEKGREKKREQREKDEFLFFCFFFQPRETSIREKEQRQKKGKKINEFQGLTSPGMVMMSEMPCTPWRRTSSASRNASESGVASPTTPRRLVF